MAMTLSLLLLALGTPPASAQPAGSATQHSSVHAARGGSSATGVATVRILSAISVGHGRSMQVPGAQQRSTRLTHPGRPEYPAQLIEFE